MMHIKRLQGPRGGGGGDDGKRLDEMMLELGVIVERGASKLSARQLAPALNAACSRPGYAGLFATAARRAAKIADRAADAGSGGREVGGVPGSRESSRGSLDGRSLGLLANSLSKARVFDGAAAEAFARAALATPALEGMTLGLLYNAFSRTRLWTGGAARDGADAWAGVEDDSEEQEHEEGGGAGRGAAAAAAARGQGGPALLRAALAAHLAEAALALPPGALDAQSVSCIANALARAPRAEGRGSPALLARLQEEARAAPRGALTAQGVATLLNALVRLDALHHPTLEHLRAAALAQPASAWSQAGGQAISMAVNALGRAGVRDAALLRVLGAAAAHIPPQRWSPQALSLTLNALARAESASPRVLEALAEAARAAATRAPDALSVALIAAALVRADHADEALRAQLSRAFVAAAAREWARPAARRSAVATAAMALSALAKGGPPSRELVACVAGLLRALPPPMPDAPPAPAGRPWCGGAEAATMLHALARGGGSGRAGLYGSACGEGEGAGPRAPAGAGGAEADAEREELVLALAGWTRSAVNGSNGRRDGQGGGMVPRELSMTIAALARLNVWDAGLLEALAQALAQAPLEELDVIDALNLLTAAALARRPRGARGGPADGGAARCLALADSLEALAGRRMAAAGGELDAQLAASVLTQLGKVNMLQDPGVQSAVLPSVRAAVEAWVRRDAGAAPDGQRGAVLAGLALALANAGEEDAALWASVEAGVRRLGIADLDAGSTAQLLAALARAGRGQPALLRPLLDAASQELHAPGDAPPLAPARVAPRRGGEAWAASGKEVGAALGALATLGQQGSPAWSAFARVAARLPAGRLACGDVASVCNAFARAGAADEALFARMSELALGKRGWDAAAAGAVANALVRAGAADTTLMAHLSREVCALPPAEIAPVPAARLLNACARLTLRDDALLAHLSAALRACPPDELDPQTVANAAHASAVLHVADVALLEQLAAALVRTPPEACAPQAVANIAWACAVQQPLLQIRANRASLGANASDRSVTDWVCSAVVHHAPALGRSGLSQVHQFLLGAVLDDLPLSAALVAMQGRCREAFLESSREAASASKPQAQVSASLRRLGYEVRDETVDPASGYSFDCFLPDLAIAVEFDGPVHFALGSRRPLGATVMKHRHVRRRGLGLAVVNFWEWDPGADPAAQDALLRGKVEAVLQRRREAQETTTLYRERRQRLAGP